MAVKLAALRTISEDYARANVLIPFDVKDCSLFVAMGDPRDGRVIEEIERLAGLSVAPYLAPDAAIRRAHLLYKGDLREMLQRSAPHRAVRAGEPGSLPHRRRSP